MSVTTTLALVIALAAAQPAQEPEQLPDFGGNYAELTPRQKSLIDDLVRRYAELGRDARRALSAFADDVRQGRFPSPEESYDDPTLLNTEPIRKIYG